MSHSGTDSHFDFAQRWEGGSVHLENLREVMLYQPKAGVLRIPREDDNALASNPSQLSEALLAARPMMNRQHRKCGVERPTLKGQLTRRCLYDLRSLSRALTYHFNR